MQSLNIGVYVAAASLLHCAEAFSCAGAGGGWCVGRASRVFRGGPQGGREGAMFSPGSAIRTHGRLLGPGLLPGRERAGALVGLSMKKVVKNPQVADNREARFNYEILEKFECGIQLVGTEVKSARAGKMNIRDGFARVEENGRLRLLNCHIAKHFTTGAFFNHEEVRPRNLLAHKAEIQKMQKQMGTKGLTLIPLRAYFNENGFIKVEIGICRGKNMGDKRDSIRDRDTGREVKRELKSAGY